MGKDNRCDIRIFLFDRVFFFNEIKFGLFVEVLSRVEKFIVFFMGNRNRSFWERIKKLLSKVDWD